MATVRQYAYYMEGSKISLVEKEAAFDNDPNSKDYGPGTDRFRWKSPLADAANGLEILYTYSPIYRTYNTPIVDVNKFYVNGWTVIGGYLAFVKNYGSYTMTNWSTSPESAVTSGTSGDTGGQTLDYIVVGGSSRWNGLHRVQTAGTTGVLTTYTKVNSNLEYWENQQVDFNTDEEIFDGGGGNLHLANHFSPGDYIFIAGSGNNKNNGLHKVSDVNIHGTAASSKITVDTRYNIPKASGTSGDEVLGEEEVVGAAFLADTEETGVDLYKAHRDHCYILSDVDVLNDEADEIDLPNYLSKAAVDYVKAKYMEDLGNYEEAEYLMAKFRKQVEKYNNSLIGGPRMIAPGPFGIR